MQFIQTKILCYDKTHEGLIKELNLILDRKDEFRREEYERKELLGRNAKKTEPTEEETDIELDIINIEKKIELAKEFRNGSMNKTYIIAFYEGDKEGELLVTSADGHYVVMETMDSFNAKLQ